jgi:hypothetical protein
MSAGRKEASRRVSEHSVSLVRLDVPAAPVATAIAESVREWLLNVS